MRSLISLLALVGASIALMIQGDFGSAAIGLLVVSMIVFTAMAPFSGMESADRRQARVTATALVLAGWFAAGALLWEWDGASYGVAGAVALFALVRAASLPAPSSAEDTPEKAREPAESGSRGA